MTSSEIGATAARMWTAAVAYTTRTPQRKWTSAGIALGFGVALIAVPPLGIAAFGTAIAGWWLVALVVTAFGAFAGNRVGVEFERRGVPLSMATFEDFAAEVEAVIQRATDQGRQHVEINAGEMHRAVGSYPGQNHRMPSCCRALRKAMKSSDLIIHAPPQGDGAALTIRYSLPRLT